MGAAFGERIHSKLENGDQELVVTTGHAAIFAVASKF
jgi:hypothetical protein